MPGKDLPRPAARPTTVRRWSLLFACVLVVVLLGLNVPSLAGGAAPSNGASGATASSSVSPILVQDDSVVSTVLGAGVTDLTDSVTPLGQGPAAGERSYEIQLGVASQLPLVSISVRTNPITYWEHPGEMPGGPDNLPPLSDFRWTITANGVNDTANWTLLKFEPELQRVTAWSDQTFVVHGFPRPTVPISVPSKLNSTGSVPHVGLFLQYPGSNAPLPTSNAAYRQQVGSLHSTIDRVSFTSFKTQSWWNTKSLTPVINFSGFDAAVNLSRSQGAALMLSIPIGTWGDGNDLPYRMPLNLSLPVTFLNSTGYFPTSAAYQTFVRTIVQHVIRSNESVEYWSIGNEQPLSNATIASRYEVLFNVASTTIHGILPHALVGSDVLTNRTFESSFAKSLHGADFLSYHYYPATGYCLANGTYCAPAGGHNDTTDAGLLRSVASISDNPQYFAPHLGQEIWYNATGQWLPVLDAESNLNARGGFHTRSVGTDPRDLTTFGAAWLTATLIASAAENVSVVTYFTATDPNSSFPVGTSSEPFGGWGFGLARPNANGTSYTEYAPYWALLLWSKNVPVGATGTPLATSDPTVVQAFAAEDSTGLNVVVANLAAAPTAVPITVNGSSYAPRSVTYLDHRSYVESYAPATKSVQLQKSSVVRTAAGPGQVTLHFQGYGVATVHYAKVTVGRPIRNAANGPTVAITPASSAAAPHAEPTTPLAPGDASVPAWFGSAAATAPSASAARRPTA